MVQLHKHSSLPLPAASEDEGGGVGDDDDDDDTLIRHPSRLLHRPPRQSRKKTRQKTRRTVSAYDKYNKLKKKKN
jgi:hypothetical protein